MAFDTIERSIKRSKTNAPFSDEWYSHETHSSNNNNNNNEEDIPPLSNKLTLVDSYYPITPETATIDIPPYYYWQDDMTSTTTQNSHRPSTCSIITNSPPNLSIDSIQYSNTNHAINTNSVVQDILSNIKLSQNNFGITLEAKIANASELRSLIDAFSQLYVPSPNTTTTTTTTPSTHHHKDHHHQMLVYRNKTNQTKPVNFFESTCLLGQLTNPHSNLIDSTEQQIADACIDTFFTCWVRYKPLLNKGEFMTWYRAQKNPLDTLIVNAICTFVFRHMVIHHPRPYLNHFLKDQDKLKEQEEYFFNAARECLANHSFDSEEPTDRYTVLGLLFMSVRAQHAKRHHYVGMATSALHQLNIYPRMVDEEPEDYNKEMDTRLWWATWAIEFALHTAGAPKNTPQPKRTGLDIDFPQVFEQDIDNDEINVIAYTHCLKLWKIQNDIIATLYNQHYSSEEELTTDAQLLSTYDCQLLKFYQKLPDYLVFDSGFEYAQEDLFVACLRVNIEYNASRIILHKLFIPERHDTQPTQASLESLNKCLLAALIQLKTLMTCTMSELGKCAFDRDELWRAAEVISVATDIYHDVSVQDRAIMLKDIPIETFTSALVQSIQVLQNSTEYKLNIKNWIQVADWIQVEIRRHQLVHPELVKTTVMQPSYFSVKFKPKIITTKKPKSTSFQNQFSIQQPFVQFNSYEPQSSGKSTARFRYFNPRKMNKFLFIDEHPM